MRKLLNRHDGVDVIFHDDGKKFVIEHKQDVEPILERNKRERNEFRSYREAEFGAFETAKYASIPAVVIIDWKERFGIDVFNPDHADAVKKKLNDPEWRHLRTTEGKI